MKRRAVFILLILISGVMSPWLAQAQSGDLLIEWDFEDGQLPDDTMYFLEDSDWQVTRQAQSPEGRVLLGDSSASDYASLTLYDSLDWENYRIEMLMNLSSQGFMFISSHSDPDIEECFTGHNLNLSFDSTSIAAYSTSEGCDEADLFNQTAKNFPFDEWVTLTLELTSTSMAAYLDGEELFNEPTESVPNGFLTLGILDGATIALDRITVTELAPTTAGGRNLPSDVSKGGTGTQNTNQTAAPTTLQELYGRYQEAVAELQALGIVPEGGRLLFVEDYAFFQGRGSWFTPLAQNSPNTNIVMAGEITFKAAATGQVLENCMLSARLVQNSRGNTSTFAGVMLFNDGWVVATDIINEQTNNSQEVDLGLAWTGETHHVLFTMLDDVMNVYIDGELVIADMEVEERRGTFGIALRGEDAESRCEGRNIWVYSFD